MKTLIAALTLLTTLTLFPDTARAGKCVIVVPQLNTQILFNACDQCKIVKVSRSRPGGGAAAKRTYAVPAKSKIEMTFKGPGQTRVQSEGPCRSGATQQSPARSLGGSTVPECIGFQRMKNGTAVLKNSCQTCRQAEIDFKFPSQPMRRETYAVGGHAIAPIKNHPGATDVYIRSETICRSRR